MENVAELAREIIATYRKHSWKLQRVLMCPETRAKVTGSEEGTRDEPAGSEEGTRDEAASSHEQIFEGVRIDEAPIDALWFTRPSHGQREAWELRLLSETQYALFETFERDEPDEAREEVRREMEARLLDYVTKK